MSTTANDNLLARLAGQQAPGEESEMWAALAATQPKHATKPKAAQKTPPPEKPAPEEDKLSALLNRINQITGTLDTTAPTEIKPNRTDFIPIEPNSFAEAELSDSQVEALILKFLLARGDASGRSISDHIKLPFRLIEELLRMLKQDRLVVHKSAAQMNDYQFELSDLSRERARRFAEHCTYFGSAPVSLRDYIVSVKAQTLVDQYPTKEDVTQAFHDLLINPKMLGRLGPAINSGRGLFLYGAPGNGKTSIAERITRAFGSYIWIPRAIGVDGEIIRLFDPSNHEAAPEEPIEGLLDQSKIDRRWVRIIRPTIVVGGELTMNMLDVQHSVSTGIGEAPLQMKSNCGTLVIDDFGRQRMSTDELLNRWIVPLEKRYDYLNLPGGKKIQVPFDQLIIFSTNLEPRDLVDDAFLRRIPYKIEITDPSEEEFRKLFVMMAEKFQIELREAPLNYLVEKHYRAIRRPFRCCHPRDLLLQIQNYCRFNNATVEMSNDTMDFAVENYFTIME